MLWDHFRTNGTESDAQAANPPRREVCIFYEYDQIGRLELIDINRHGEFISQLILMGLNLILIGRKHTLKASV